MSFLVVEKTIGNVFIWQNPETGRYGATIFQSEEREVPSVVASGYPSAGQVECDLRSGLFARGEIPANERVGLYAQFA